MKQIFMIFMAVMLLFSFVETQAQYNFAKDYKGDYSVTTLYTGTLVSVGDTSDYWIVPSECNTGIFYIGADSVSTSDSLKTMILQGSADLTNWFSIDTYTAIGAEATYERSVVTNIDKYVRFIYDVAGSDVAITFTLKGILKKE